jgi:hypothetical protein
MYMFQATTIPIVAATADLSPPSSRILPSCWTIGAGGHGWPWALRRARRWLGFRRAGSQAGNGSPPFPRPAFPGAILSFFKNNLLVDNFSQFFDLKKMISTHT